MKKQFVKIMTAVLALCLGAFPAGCGEKDGAAAVSDRGTWTVKSPDGTIQAVMTLDADGRMTYTVDKGGVRVVEKSELGMDIAEDDFGVTTVHAAGSRRVTGSYENKSGKAAEVSYDCNETTVTLKGWEFYLDVTMRCYDDGYAFRYGIRAIDDSSGTMTVLDEKTEFALPDKTNMWVEEYISTAPARGEFFSYEVPYNRRSAAGLTDEYLAMPLLYRAGTSDIYSMITESQLIGSGFYGSYLKVPKAKAGSGVLKTEHTPAGCKLDDNRVEYPFESPWRVGITGDMKTVNESELVEKVYDDVDYWKPDEYDELPDEQKAIYDYDWVQAGVCAWSWLTYSGQGRGQNDYSLHREYVDLAYEMGWTYVLLDAGWDNNLDNAQFREFIDYAAVRNVKILVWCDALVDFANGNVEILRAKLDKWADLGIAGIKIDFFDGLNATNPTHRGEDIDTIKWYETVYRETARHKMVVNCHGSNKPTGERRQYPNVLNREGIMGNEFKSVGASVTVNQMFTRGVVGPSDFTPVVTPLSDNLTPAHQLALSVLYESGAPSMGDYTAAYKDEKIYRFFKAVPSLRDQTVFVSGRPDDHYCAAVRAGNEWFVAAVNSVLETEITVDFSFLGDGEYDAELFTDGADGLTREVRTIRKGDTIALTLLEKGGFAMRLTPKK